MSIAILITQALFDTNLLSVCLFMLVECGVLLAHSTTHDVYKQCVKLAALSLRAFFCRDTGVGFV
jgi:hypothetical protein